jgi:murein DD-endopeptidase
LPGFTVQEKYLSIFIHTFLLSNIKMKNIYDNIIKPLFFIITLARGAEQTFSQEYRQTLVMRIPYKPGLVIINGKPTVYYEIHLTNFASDSIKCNTLKIFDTIDSTLVASIDKDDLNSKHSRPALPPGTSSVIYLEIILQNDKANVQLAHRLEFEMLPGNGQKLLSVVGGLINLSNKPQIVLGPPLSAGTWAAVYEPSWERGHRRMIYTVDGKARIPGRFAIDFIRLDSQGRYANKDDNLVKNWFGYGMNVLAVADGVVASTRDDFPESATLSGHPKYTAGEATGNYISIDIGNNHIVFYEHLKPGSIKVKPGQQVKKGDIIASIGLTGQTTGPHLHFHVADENSPLGAEGIPFAFESFTVLGSYADFEKFGKEPWVPVRNSHQSTITGERPAPKSVIKFQP